MGAAASRKSVHACPTEPTQRCAGAVCCMRDLWSLQARRDRVRVCYSLPSCAQHPVRCYESYWWPVASNRDLLQPAVCCLLLPKAISWMAGAGPRQQRVKLVLHLFMPLVANVMLHAA